jgi:hypothetical protein
VLDGYDVGCGQFKVGGGQNKVSRTGRLLCLALDPPSPSSWF